MKALRYLLIVGVVMALSTMTMQARGNADSPMIEMQSTSVVPPSGSSLPQAASTGVVLSDGTLYSSGPRRAKMDENPFGDQTIDDVNNPEQPGSPIGDGLWALMLMAFGYAGYMVYRRRKVAEV